MKKNNDIFSMSPMRRKLRVYKREFLYKVKHSPFKFICKPFGLSMTLLALCVVIAQPMVLVLALALALYLFFKIIFDGQFGFFDMIFVLLAIYLSCGMFVL